MDVNAARRYVVHYTSTTNAPLPRDAEQNHRSFCPPVRRKLKVRQRLGHPKIKTKSEKQIIRKRRRIAFATSTSPLLFLTLVAVQE